MSRHSIRLVVVLACAAVVAGVLALPSAATVRTAEQGVTKDEIVVVALVADVDTLRNRGVPLPAKTTVANFAKRFQGPAEAFGPIHGRTVVVKTVAWDSQDPTSFDRACTQATQDNKPFVVVHNSGFRNSSIPCITADNDTPMFMGDGAYDAVRKASGKNLLTLGLPPEMAARSTAQVVAREKLVPKSAKIGILSNNIPDVKAAGDTLEAELENRGYDVVTKVEINGLAADVSLASRESAAAVPTMTSAGVDTVFVPQSFTPLSGFFQEAARSNAAFEYFSLDGQANVCTLNGAMRIPAAVAGAPCITPWDGRAVQTKDKIKADTAFEAKCRQQFDAFMDEKSQPGVPNGDITVNGVTWTEDMATSECTIMSLLLPAIKQAGKNPTWDKVHAKLMAIDSAPAAYMSDGEGGFAKNKPYFANKVHVVAFTPAGASTTRAANGTFDGCPAPTNCWIPQLLGGQEWFPIPSTSSS